MDDFNLCLTLMKKWESDQGATTTELEELLVLLGSVTNEVTESIAHRYADL